jgi:hypothetical protein
MTIAGTVASEKFQIWLCLRTAVLLLAVLVGSSSGALAGSLGAPIGDAILTISGAIGSMNGDGTAVFDRAMLETLPKVTITTANPWTSTPAKFEGVSLTDLLAAVVAKGSSLKAVALNDYAVDLPKSDADQGAIVAYRVDGHELTVRDKGPLWIIFPFDSKPELKTETYYSRCIWQLSKLIISN